MVLDDSLIILASLALQDSILSFHQQTSLFLFQAIDVKISIFLQEEIYVEEKKAQVKQMMAIHLETFPVAKGAFENKTGLYKMKKSHNNIISMMDVNDDSDAVVSKSVTGLSFNLQVSLSSTTYWCL